MVAFEKLRAFIFLGLFVESIWQNPYEDVTAMNALVASTRLMCHCQKEISSSIGLRHCVAFPVIYLDSLDHSFCSFWCWVCVIFLQMLWLEKLNKETSLWCFWVLFGCIYGMRNSFLYEVIVAVQVMAIWIWRDDALRFSLRDEFYMSWEFCWSSVLVISWPWIRNNLELQRD